MVWRPDSGRQIRGGGWPRGPGHLSSPLGVWLQLTPQEKRALATWGGQQQALGPSAQPGTALEGPRSPAPASRPVLTWEVEDSDRPLGESK